MRRVAEIALVAWVLRLVLRTDRPTPVVAPPLEDDQPTVPLPFPALRDAIAAERAKQEAKDLPDTFPKGWAA